jgi:hypothetical protein
MFALKILQVSAGIVCGAIVNDHKFQALVKLLENAFHAVLQRG